MFGRDLATGGRFCGELSDLPDGSGLAEMALGVFEAWPIALVDEPSGRA